MIKWLMCWILILSSATSEAALPARVEKGELKMYAAPNASSKVLLTIPEGTAFEASNYPIEGFYKIRINDGTVGWVSADRVTLYDPETQDTISKPKWGRIEKKHWFLKFHGGANYLLYPSLTENYPSDFTQMGLSFFGGLEMQYLLDSGSGFFWGGEYLFWNGTGADTTDTYSIRSIPIHAGLVLIVVDGAKFQLKIKLGGTIAVMNQFRVTGLDGGSSYIQPILAYGGIGKLELNFALSQDFGLYFDLGGRALLSEAVEHSSDNSIPRSFTQNFTMYGAHAGLGFFFAL